MHPGLVRHWTIRTTNRERFEIEQIMEIFGGISRENKSKINSSFWLKLSRRRRTYIGWLPTSPDHEIRIYVFVKKILLKLC